MDTHDASDGGDGGRDVTGVGQRPGRPARLRSLRWFRKGGPEALLPTGPHPTQGGAPGGGRVPGSPFEVRDNHLRAPALPTPAALPSWLLKGTLLLWGLGVEPSWWPAAPSSGPVSCVALSK